VHPVDAATLLTRPAFWAVHLGLSLGHDLDPDLAALFGVDLGLARGTYLRLTDAAGWPRFRISTPAGAQVTVTYRNAETDYTLTPPAPVIPPTTAVTPAPAATAAAAATDALATVTPPAAAVTPPPAPTPAATPAPALAAVPITIGTAEGTPDGPALSWPELRALAVHHPDPTARAQTLLLLSPLLGADRTAPADLLTAALLLAAALHTTGVPGDATTIATRLAGAQPTTWRSVDGVRLCDHPGSTRNPAGNRTLSPQDQATVSHLLDPATPC
jgi:hypothetical protein